MFKSLSKSTWIMFIFDLITLLLSTFLWSHFFGYTPKAVVLLCLMVTAIGLIVLYLKGNYKIREFNINLKNTYLLFEGIVMAHVFPALYLLVFAASITYTLMFLTANVLTIFIVLRVYIVRQPKFKMFDTKLKYSNFAFC